MAISAPRRRIRARPRGAPRARRGGGPPRNPAAPLAKNRERLVRASGIPEDDRQGGDDVLVAGESRRRLAGHLEGAGPVSRGVERRNQVPPGGDVVRIRHDDPAIGRHRRLEAAILHLQVRQAELDRQRSRVEAEGLLERLAAGREIPPLDSSLPHSAQAVEPSAFSGPRPPRRPPRSRNGA